MVGFVLNAASGVVVTVLNASRAARTVRLPAAGWEVLVDAERAGAKPFARIDGNKVAVPALSATVLTRRLAVRRLSSAGHG
jgi:hypothetical protein